MELEPTEENPNLYRFTSKGPWDIKGVAHRLQAQMQGAGLKVDCACYDLHRDVEELAEEVFGYADDDEP